MQAVLLILRLGIAAILSVAGVAKLRDLSGSRRAVADFGVPERFSAPVAVSLPVIELALAGLLLCQSTAAWSGVGAAALMAMFVGALARAVIRGESPDCHCFGQLHSAPARWSTVARSVVLGGMAAFVAVAGWKKPGTSPIEWIGSLSAAQAMGAGAGVALAGVLAFQVWFSFQLLRQNGRLLNRLEALEQLGLGPNDARTAAQRAPGMLPSTAYGLSVGSAAPDFLLPDVDGSQVTLQRLRDGRLPTLLVFSDPGCGPCNALIPQLAEWQRREPIIVAVLSRGDVNQTRARAREHGLRNVLLQHDREVAQRYGAHGTPAAVLVDTQGRIASRLAQGAAAIEELVNRAKEAGGPPVLEVRQNGSSTFVAGRGEEPGHR